MEENTKKKEVSYLQKMWDNFIRFIEKAGDNLKFKEGENLFIKFLKVLLRIIGILVLIAISPLLIVTLMIVMVFAM